MNAVAVVPRAEHDLLVVARALVQPGSFDSVEAILRGSEARAFGPEPDAEVAEKGPSKISPTGLRLLTAALANGSVLALARGGGFRSRSRLAGGGKTVIGRLWQAHPELDLRFSPYSFELVRWLASAGLAGARVPKLASAVETVGDELVAYFACALVEGSEIAGVVASQPAVQSSALAWLGFPRMLALASTGARPPSAADFARLVSGVGAIVIEGLEDELGRRYVNAVQVAAKVADVRLAARAGSAQVAVLDAFLGAADAASRRDLASFLVTAAGRLLAGGASPRALAGAWCGWLNPAARLADRALARRSTAAPVRALARLGQWYEEMSVMRFFDDGYDAAQMLLARWEVLGPEGFARAADVARELDALDAGADAEPEATKEAAR